MAATALTPRQATTAGLQVRAADLASPDGSNGNSYVNGPNTWVVIRNDGAATNVVPTFVTSFTKLGLALSDESLTMAANDILIIPPKDPEVYGSTVTITWAGTLTNVTVGVIYR